MFFGQLANMDKVRGEYKCVLSTCDMPINEGDECLALVVRNRAGSMFTRRAHWDCFTLYLREAIVGRKQVIRDRRASTRPTRTYQIEPEKMKRRLTVLQYVSQQQKRLLLGYVMRKEETVAKAKAGILRYLAEIDEGELGPPYKFVFSQSVLEMLAAGADPLITEAFARTSNEEEGNARAIELLNPGRPAYEELDREVQVAIEPKSVRLPKKRFYDKLKNPKHVTFCQNLEREAHRQWPNMSDADIDEKVQISYKVHLKEGELDD